MDTQEELIAQATKLIQMGEKVLTTESGDSRSTPIVDEQKFHDFRISALSYISRVFGNESHLCGSLKSEVTHPTVSRTKRGIAILTAARRDLQNDWLTTLSGTIAKDVLIDTLRIARFSIEQNQFGAAVVIGSALLEKALRLLALSHGLTIHNELANKAVPKRALQLTGELYKKKAYDRQDNKAIIIWIELGQAAGKPGFTVNAGQAKEMLNGIQAFITKIRI